MVQEDPPLAGHAELLAEARAERAKSLARDQLADDWLAPRREHAHLHRAPRPLDPAVLSPVAFLPLRAVPLLHCNNLPWQHALAERGQQWG